MSKHCSGVLARKNMHACDGTQLTCTPIATQHTAAKTRVTLAQSHSVTLTACIKPHELGWWRPTQSRHELAVLLILPHNGAAMHARHITLILLCDLAADGVWQLVHLQVLLLLVVVV